jgi:hypothetical protein
MVFDLQTGVTPQERSVFAAFAATLLMSACDDDVNNAIAVLCDVADVPLPPLASLAEVEAEIAATMTPNR